MPFDQDEYQYEIVSWIRSAKAIEIVAASVNMSCCPSLVDQCIIPACTTTESVLTARTMLDIIFTKIRPTRSENVSEHQKKSAFYNDNMNQKIVPKMFDRIDRSNFPLIISEILATIYEFVSECQLVVVTSLLKGLLVCGDHVPYEHTRGTDNANIGIPVQRRGNSSSIPHRPTNELQKKIVLFARNVFNCTLSTLCKKHPNTIARMTSTLDTYVPLLSL